MPARLTLLVLVVALSACPKDQTPPTPACQMVLDCYFPEGGGGLSAVPGFEGLFPLDSNIVRQTYGPGGTCWVGDDEDVVRSCDDRCKGLLWQDCARSYRRVCNDDNALVCLVDGDCTDAGVAGPCVAQAREGPAGEFEAPFCAAACTEEFSLGCRFEDFAILQGQGRQADEPLFSACPERTRCNAVPLEFAGPNEPPEGISLGCCENLERGLLVDDRTSCNPPPPPAE